MKIFVILSIMFRAVVVIDYGNAKTPNYCEKHFLLCPNALERADDCEYFLDHRCQYVHKRVARLRHPALYRRDQRDFTRHEGDLPHYKCLALDHLKISWKRELKYEGNRKTKWIVMVPSRAFPLDLLKRTFIQVDKTLPEKALWETEDMSDYSEFVYEYDDHTICADNANSFKIKDIDGRRMAQEEFDLRNDRHKYYDLRMITIVVIKDDQQSCARIHPKYSNHNQQSNVVTHVVGAERAYAAYDRVSRMRGGAPPWAAGDELRRARSAWCRSQRHILALAEARIISEEGEGAALTGPRHCSLYLWERQRVIRLPFGHGGQQYVVKVVLQLNEDSKSWTPLNIELRKRLERAHERLGDPVQFAPHGRAAFAQNETFYSPGPALVLGNDRLRLRIRRLGVEFDPKQSPFNFSVPFHSKKSSSSIAIPPHKVGKSKCYTRSTYPTGPFGQAPPGFGDGHPGFGHGHPGFGDGHPGFGDGHPGFGDGHPGFGDGHPGFGDGYPGFGDGYPGFGNGHPGFGQGPSLGDEKGKKSSKRNEEEERRERYRKVRERAKYVLLPFLLAVFLLALLVAVLRFAHGLRHWLYDKLIAPVAGKRAGAGAGAAEPLGALQRAALAAQYARAQAANLTVYTVEGAAIVAALRALCAARDRLLAAAARPAHAAL